MKFYSRPFRGRLIFLAAILLASCGWWRSADEDENLSKPYPLGGYEEISKRIYYPADLQEMGIEGKVRVRALVDTSGTVTKTAVINSLHPVLDDIAQNAVRKTPFFPAMAGDHPVAVWVSIPIEFAIADLALKETPFQSFILEIHPDANFESSRVKLFARIKNATPLPMRLELLIPFSAEHVAVYQGAAQERVLVAHETNFVDLEEWLVCLIENESFEIDMTTKTIPELQENDIRFTLRLNHAVPAWSCRIVTLKPGVEMDFGEYRVTQEQKASGEVIHTIKFPGMTAYEPQHLEISLKN